MKNNKIIWIIGILIVLAFFANQKKESIERVEIQWKEMFTNDFIAVSSGSFWSTFSLTFIMDFPIGTTSEGQEAIFDFNQDLSTLGIPYNVPYSISDCSDLKNEGNELITSVKLYALNFADEINEGLSLLPDDKYPLLRTNANTLLSKFSITETISNGKRVISLDTPTISDIDVACATFNSDFPFSYINTLSRVDVCGCFDNGEFLYNVDDLNGVCYGEIMCNSPFHFLEEASNMCNSDELYELQLSIDIHVVCEDNMLFITNDNVKYNTFLLYNNGGTPDFEYYRDWYMDNLDGGELTSSMTLGACLTDSDCTGDEECISNKCTIQGCEDTTWSPAPSTVCEGDAFTQKSNCDTTRDATGTKSCPSDDTTTDDDKEWYENPIVWIIAGIALLFMFMMNKG